MHKKIHGFTLIELLVVIAIIGILSSVVIVNLNSARDKGQDAAIKTQVAQLRSAAVIYESDNNNFGTNTTAVAPATSACNTGTAVGMFADANVQKGLTGLKSNAEASNVLCGLGANGQSWVVYAQLRGVASTYWCADSTGIAKTSTVTSGQVCP